MVDSTSWLWEEGPIIFLTPLLIFLTPLCFFNPLFLFLTPFFFNPHCFFLTPPLFYTLYTWHPTPRTLHCTLYAPLHTLRSTAYSLHLILYTSHCTLYAPHSTFYSPHSTLHTLHFHTLHLTLHFRSSQLFTFYAAWNLGLAWFSCCARALAFCPQLPFFRCITSSRASKGPLRCRRWTFEASPITCQYVGYADIRQPLRATVHTHMFYPRPLQQTVPQYVGLDVHLTCMRFRPARAGWCKKQRCALCVFIRSSLPS